MVKKLVLVGGLALVLALGLIAGRGTPTKAFVVPGIQDFNLDLVNCLVAGGSDTVSPDPEAGYPQICAAGEDKSPGGATSYSTAIGLIAGNRQGLPYVYSGPGWVLQPDASVPNGTIVGDVASTIDIYADGLKDVLGNASNCGGPPNSCGTALTLPTTAPEDYVKQTLAWSTTSGCDGTDETNLNDILPGASAMTPYIRYRACLTTLYLQGKYRLDIKAVNGVTTPLNLVNLTLNWQPTTIVNLISLGGEAASPSSGLLTQDTPQASISHTDAPYAANPPAPGLYVRWMTEISNEDAADRALNWVYSTSCKVITGSVPALVDGDADCLATVANPGGPADTNDAIADQDGDGLLDGVEVAWGSNPLLADTDLDGRTDAEEMVGPTQLLTNPKVADTDIDGVPDGGLTLDANGDGVPDCPDANGDGKGNSALCPQLDVADTGISANLDTSLDGSSHRRVGFRIVGWDIQPDKAGTDNCPGIPNGPAIPGPGGDIQNNFDLDSASSWGHGDLYGDACDSDDENDNFPDAAEPTFQWDAGAHQCANDKDLPGGPTALSLLNPDSDGDGVLDGSECWGGSNPFDAGDTPGAPATTGTPADKDALNNAMEIDRRTEGFSDQPPPAPIGVEDIDGDGKLGKSDSDSDADGLSDGCETFVTGTSPMRPDSDSNGTPDGSESNLVGPGKPITLHCKNLEDMDNDGVTDDTDNCPFVANGPADPSNQVNTDPKIGNGKGIAGDDITVPWSVKTDKKGDACDGDLDNDGTKNASDTEPGGPGGDITYDDGPAVGGDGTWKGAGDDGPSWDTNVDAKLDGVAACAGSLGAWGSLDSDGDGLLNSLEFCKWGSSPLFGRVDSDGDGVGDCKEVADVDGNNVVNFPGDVIYYAKAILLPPASFGQDGDFDLDGNNTLNFPGDVIQEAKFGLIAGLCK
jgi:hypothetical protein